MAGAPPLPCALVLAGGLGTRLRPALPDRPKVLAPVAGRPFLGHLLRWLALAGADRAVLCTGHGAAAVEAAFGSRWAGLALRHSAEPLPLGTGGALRRALALAPDARFLVLNGDSLCGLDPNAMLRSHRRARAAATVAIVRVPDAARYGAVRLDRRRRVTAFVEKGAVGPGWINAGVYAIERAVLEALPADRPCSLEAEVFPGLIGAGLRGFLAPGPFADIGTPESWAGAAEALAGVLA